MMKGFFKRRSRSAPKVAHFPYGDRVPSRQPSPRLGHSNSSREVGVPPRISPPTDEKERIHQELRKLTKITHNLETNGLRLQHDNYHDHWVTDFDREKWRFLTKDIREWQPPRDVYVRPETPPPSVLIRREAQERRRREMNRLRREVLQCFEDDRRARSLSRSNAEIQSPTVAPTLTFFSDAAVKLLDTFQTIRKNSLSFKILINEAEEEDEVTEDKARSVNQGEALVDLL